MAVKFGIGSALSITAVYGFLLAMMRPLGVAGIVAAVVSGTAISGVIIFASRRDLGAILWVMIGTVIGSVVGLAFLSSMILSHQYGYDHGFGETARSNIMGGVIGAMCGGLIASLMYRIKAD
jgi:uncharacterized membrane protein YfcA